VEDLRLNKAKLVRNDIFRKCIAITLAVLMVVSTVATASVMIIAENSTNSEFKPVSNLSQRNPCKVSSVLSDEGLWISFDSSSVASTAEAHVTVSDTSGITIAADFHGFWQDNVTLNGTIYDTIDMPGACSMHASWKPMLPRLTKFLEIPHNIDVSLEIISTESEFINDYFVRPALPLASPVGIDKPIPSDPPSIILTPFVLDAVYSLNTSYPGYEVSMEGGENETSSIIMRGHRLLEVSVFPIQYYPADQVVQVFSQIVFRVNYLQPAQIEPIAQSMYSKSFEDMLERFLLNYENFTDIFEPIAGMASTYIPVEFPYVIGAEYLIITTDTFKDQARRLANWKIQKGIPTKIEILPPAATNDYVKIYLEQVWQYWVPKPTYVLLFGDCETIPTNYDVVHDAKDESGAYYYNQNSGFIGSDLGYFTFDGVDDYLQDMVYGRLSVDTWEQAQTVIDKILEYELSPPQVPDFYHNILSTAYFEDGVYSPSAGGWVYDDQEEEGYRYVYYAERIREYIENQIGNYMVHMNYSADVYPGEPMHPERFYNGDGLYKSSVPAGPLPDDFEWISAWHWTQAENNISANINEGRFLVYHLDHGGSYNNVYEINERDEREGFYFPYYDVTSLSGLYDNNMTPLIISTGCSVGWFDGERDHLDMDNDNVPSNTNLFTLYNSECFAEAITRMQGGAVAVIAASRMSYTLAAADMLEGIIKSFWPGYSPNAGEPVYEMGTALLLGKLYADTLWRDAETEGRDVTRVTSEVFHLFGDPELQLRTSRPHRFDVTYPVSVGTTDPQRFVVTVRDQWTGELVENAKICVQQNPNVYQVGYTNTIGQVIFDVTPSAAHSFVNVTVTKHNFVPHLGFIRVHDSPAELTLSMYSGEHGDQVEFTISGFGTETVGLVLIFFDEHLVATLDTGDTEVLGNVPSGLSGYVNVWAARPNCMTLERFWIPVTCERFKREFEDMNTDPSIYSQWDESTWIATGGERVWNNPDIWILEDGSPATEVVRGNDYEVMILVHNWGTERAEEIDVNLYYAPFGGGVSWKFIGEAELSIDPESAEIAIIPWTPILPDLACLRVELYHEFDLNTNNNVGQDNVVVVELTSPGERNFWVGNQFDTSAYVYINVRQQGTLSDIWNATILNYSSQMIGSGNNESVTLLIDPGTNVVVGEWRVFTADIYVEGELVGGMTFNATQVETTWSCLNDPICIAFGVAVCIFVIVIIHRRRSD